MAVIGQSSASMSRSVSDVRDDFVEEWREWMAAGAPDGQTLEVVGASFIADQPSIFGRVNEDYVRRELAWYDSQSYNVDDIPGGAPAIWSQVASEDRLIHSNYGALLYSLDNWEQYRHIVDELHRDEHSRRAVAIYTRPTMHQEWDVDGMSDFVCTNVVHYLVRDGALHVVVQMRSNDAVFGYRNDYAWQLEVQRRLHADLLDRYPDLELGHIIWQAASLHVYPRHFHLVRTFTETGEWDVPTERRVA